MSYFRVVVGSTNEAAELYLYGIIGQEKYWLEEDEEALTDLAVVRAIRSLEESHRRINIRINSPGGMLYHGDAIISAIMNSRAEIHTYNDGIAASMAADIWLCAPNRHMPMHAKTMLHNTSTIVYGNAKQLRREADLLEKMDGISIAMLGKCTGMTEDEIRTKFYNYEDNWLTAKECEELGLIPQIEDYSSNAAMPEAPERMSATALLRFYGQASTDADPAHNSPAVHPNGQRGTSLLERMRRTLFGSTEPNESKPDEPEFTQSQSNEMTSIEELRRALEDSSITEDQLIDLVRERGYNAERRAEPETVPPVAAAADPAPDPRIAEMERKLDDMMAMLRQQGKVPGAKPAAVAADGDVSDEAGNALEAYNRQMAAAAQNGDAVRVTK